MKIQSRCQGRRGGGLGGIGVDGIITNGLMVL